MLNLLVESSDVFDFFRGCIVNASSLPAADFAGCVKAFTEKKEENISTLDRFGMPIIKGSFVYDDTEENVIFYVNPNVLKVNVRGMFGR